MLKIVSFLLFAAWLVLMLVGRGGFVHLLLLSALGIAMVDIVTTIRSRMTVRD